LAYWDEWNDLDRERMARDPHAGPALRHLQRVEEWLNESLLAQQDCPTPEVLFRLKGPSLGAWRPDELSAEEREEALAHIAICPTCSVEAASLATPPPATLLIADPEPFEVEAPPAWDASSPRAATAAGPAPERSSPAPAAEQARTTRPPHRFSQWRAGFLAAAALLLVWFLATRTPQSVAGSAAWPEVETLRGSPVDGLQFPRGAVLARSPEGHWSGPLEIAPVEGASEYIVRLYAHDGSAFDMGTRIAEWRHATPVIPSEAPLPPGFYTAEVFAVRGALETPLPVAEFEVRHSPATLEHLAKLKGVARVNYLHANGWRSDARREAMALPASAERSAYLQALQPR